MKVRFLIYVLVLILVTAACTEEGSDSSDDTNNNSTGGDFVAVENVPVRPANLPESRVDEVIDGDTVDLEDGTRIRLIGINTPERDQPYYDDASNFTQSLLEGQTVGIEYDVEETDQYDRTLAYLWVGDKLANYEIVRAGYANDFSLPPNVKYEVYFAQAVEKAIAEGKGIWQAGQASLAIDFVQYDPPGPDDERINEEYVRIYNASSAPLEIAGFTVSDDSRNVYTFGDIILQPNERVTIFSGCGVDTPPSRVYWCSQSPVWNNSGDTVYINDPQGLLVARQVVVGN